MASRTQRRKDRVKKLSINQLLFDLGYRVHPDIGDREEQFSCNLHGDGLDVKPSARVYPDNSFYCFVCDKTRDTIETIRDIKDLNFMDAISWLEKKYGLDPLPWEASDSEREQTPRDRVTEPLNRNLTFEDDHLTFKKFLMGITKERDIPLDVAVSYWEALDRLDYCIQNKVIKEYKGRQALREIKQRLLKAVNVS